MCVVSYVVDYGDNFFFKKYYGPGPNISPTFDPILSKLDEIKRELEQLKEVLKAAKIFDDKTGQPDCTKEEKWNLIKRLAEMAGVDLSEFLPNKDSKT